LRIISGKHKGILLHPPQGLPVRPTTDRAKESLFNILANHFYFEELSVIDLFAGTGNISFEFCSRGANSVIAVDKDAGCINYIKTVKQRLELNSLKAIKQDVYTYIGKCTEKAHIIFADASYADKQLLRLPDLILTQNILHVDGWLIVEHGSDLDFSSQYGYFDKRIYGQSAFSFFKNASSIHK
jgi:16S rRNA (guanine(966)-N(2))-methyltransferase RsmD